MIPEPFTLERPGADWTRHGKTQAPKILPPPGEVWRTPGGRKQAGRYYTRVTTLVKALEEAHALYGWKVRRAVVGLGQRPDLQLLAASLTVADHDRAAVEELAERCIEASGTSAAAVGTALHAFTERLDRGEAIEYVPEAFRELVEAWQRITAPLRLEYREVHTVHDGLGAAGTPDAFGFCELPDPDGVVDERRVIDLKSGRIDYPAAMSGQLYVYASSDLYDPETGERRPLEVNRRWGLIAHIKSDGTEPPGLYWLNLEHGRRCVELAIPVREWRAVKADAIIRPALVEERVPAMPAPGDELVDITERLVVPSERVDSPSTLALVHAAARDADERCDLSDLLVSECACRVHRDGETLAHPDPIAAGIAAAGSPRELELLWQQHREAWLPEHDDLAVARRQQVDEQRALERPQAALEAAIATAEASSDLLALWRAHAALWTDEHHALAAARRRELEGAA